VGLILGSLHRLVQGDFPGQVLAQLPIAGAVERASSWREAHTDQMADLIQQSSFHHLVNPLVNSSVQFLAAQSQADGQRVQSLPRPLAVLRRLSLGSMVDFQGPDYPADIAGVQLASPLWVNLLQLLI
jgi:hypothetical protein